MQKSVEKGRDKNACLQISRDSEQFFSRSTFANLYQGIYSTVFATVTNIMSQNDILRFSEEDLRRCVRIGAPSLYATYTIVRTKLVLWFILITPYGSF